MFDECVADRATKQHKILTFHEKIVHTLSAAFKKKRKKEINDLGRILTEWAAHTKVCVS